MSSGEKRSRERSDDREALFDEVYVFARRSAQVRFAMIGGLEIAFLAREDLEQEALVNLWRALCRYEPGRAALRTYAERIIATTIASQIRRSNAKKRTYRAASDSEAESDDFLVRIELRIDLDRVLKRLARSDRSVARLLLHYNPSEVAGKLRISRAAVYRSVSRIRLALQAAGFGEF